MTINEMLAKRETELNAKEKIEEIKKFLSDFGMLENGVNSFSAPPTKLGVHIVVKFFNNSVGVEFDHKMCDGEWSKDGNNYNFVSFSIYDKEVIDKIVETIQAGVIDKCECVDLKE